MTATRDQGWTVDNKIPAASAGWNTVPAAQSPKILSQQVVGYQLGPLSVGADSPFGQFLASISGMSRDYNSGLSFLQAHPAQAAAWTSQQGAAIGGTAGQVLGVGVNAVASAGGGLFAGVGPGVGQGAAMLGTGIGSGVSAAGTGVGLGVGNAASGIGAGVGSAAMAAGQGVGAGVGGAAAGIGTGLGEALPAAGAGVGIGAGAGLAGLGSGIGNALSGIVGTNGGQSFGLIALALAGLLLLLILAR